MPRRAGRADARLRCVATPVWIGNFRGGWAHGQRLQRREGVGCALQIDEHRGTMNEPESRVGNNERNKIGEISESWMSALGHVDEVLIFAEFR